MSLLDTTKQSNMGCTLPACELSGTCTLCDVAETRSQTGGTSIPEEWEGDVNYSEPSGPYYDMASWDTSCTIVLGRIRDINCPNGNEIDQLLRRVSNEKRKDGTIYRFYGDNNEYQW